MIDTAARMRHLRTCTYAGQRPPNEVIARLLFDVWLNTVCQNYTTAAWFHAEEGMLWNFQFLSQVLRCRLCDCAVCVRVLCITLL